MTAHALPDDITGKVHWTDPMDVDPMDVVGRRNPNPNLHAGLAAMLAQQLLAESVILIRNKIRAPLPRRVT
jgi:hypothetical protein